MPDEKSIKYWITLSQGWDGCPIAYHIQEEGGKSYLGQVQSKKELGLDDDEEADDKIERLKQYDGMIRKETAAKLVGGLKKVKNKDDYFILCDQNNLFEYAEQLLKAGFTKGLFPTKEDYEMEKNREDAMKFVEDNYPDVQIIPHEKYATIDEAKKAVEEADVPLVIQSEGDHVPTICPVDDVEQNHIEILAALDRHAKDYAHGAIILKEKLVKPVEITPQIVFWNGEPIYTSLDIETKNIGDGENNGNQVGCGTNLMIATEMDDEINRIAFPPKVFEMAKERTGIFVWDISLYFTDTGIYFGEFCSNRFGYDSLMTEMTMAHGPSEYFTKIMNGQNPISDFKFGTSIRVFNLNRTADQEITVGSWKPTWLYEATKKDDKIVSVGNGWDLGVITGRGNTVEEAVDNVYDNLDTFTFKEKYTRSKADFLADYPTSIVHRYKATNGTYYSGPDVLIEEKGDADFKKIARDIEELSSTVKSSVEDVHKGISTLKESQDKLGTVKTTFKEKLKKLYARS